jgi:RHS repeat-associated protein
MNLYPILYSIRLSYSKDSATNQLKIMDEIEERDSRIPEKRRSHLKKNDEQNHYYPFGLKHEVYISGGKRDYRAIPDDNDPRLIGVTQTDYQYKYNGQEFQDELGLNWTAMDYRNYDPAIGRFVNIDALTELMPDWTPYRFGFNSPVYWADSSGLFESNGFKTCPTCPNTPEFKPFIDDPDNEYVYDPNTNSVTPVIELEEATVIASNNSKNNQKSEADKWAEDIGKFSRFSFTASKPFADAWTRSTKYGTPYANQTTTIRYEKALPKWLGGKTIINQPIMEMNAIKASKTASTLKIVSRASGALSGGLSIYDMTQNGVTTSNTLDLTMSALAVTPSGVGQAIAATYFISNAISVWTTGQDIGQHMDANGLNLGEALNSIAK